MKKKITAESSKIQENSQRVFSWRKEENRIHLQAQKKLCPNVKIARRGDWPMGNLNGIAGVQRRGLREDAVAQPSAAVVVDAELNPHSPLLRLASQLRADARQRLRHKRRHPAVQYLVRLRSTGAEINRRVICCCSFD